MKVIIDRFEGNFAVVEIEEGHVVNVPKVLFPNAKEGDVIKIEIDHVETKERKERIKALMDELFIEKK